MNKTNVGNMYNKDGNFKVDIHFPKQIILKCYLSVSII